MRRQHGKQLTIVPFRGPGLALAVGAKALYRLYLTANWSGPANAFDLEWEQQYDRRSAARPHLLPTRSLVPSL
jgi:hypothetical protein